MPKGILVGLFSQFVFMPPLGFAVAKALTLPDHYAIALVIMVCCPGGAISNILCVLFQADVAMSVAMTTASSIVACGMLPLNLVLYITEAGLADNVRIEMTGILMSAVTVVVATFGGIIIAQKCAPRLVLVVGILGLLAGTVTLFLSFGANVGSATPLWETPSKVIFASFLPVLVGACLGLSAARCMRLPWPSAIAVGIETSVQNKLIAIAIIGLTFPGDELQPLRDAAYAVPMLYATFATFGNFIWCVVAWKMGLTFLPKDAKCSEVRENYKAARAKQSLDYKAGEHFSAVHSSSPSGTDTARPDFGTASGAVGETMTKRNVHEHSGSMTGSLESTSTTL